MKLKVKKLHEDAILPEYAHEGDAGMDVRFLGEYGSGIGHNDKHGNLIWGGTVGPYTIDPGQRYLARTGLAIEMDEGFEAQVRSKSGRALKEGLIVLNSPGTIDNGYRGEIAALLFNAGERAVTISPGEKIAQLVIAPIVRAEIEKVEEIGENIRGARGFGSTGLT